jgi:hypothetical protein
MTELQASRTLVKSPPELWAECSDAASLARHLGRFGEIRITRLEPETAVAWEGERARGTVRIEPAGWGTKVILTAVEMDGGAPPVVEIEPVVEPEPVEEPVVVVSEPREAPAAESPPRRPRFARLRAFLRGPESAADSLAVDPPPETTSPPVAEAPAVAEPPPAPEEPVDEGSDAQAALAAALDSLGQAHHRPYSRA